MPKCSLCDDTGVFETGNNDLPCKCPAGQTARFNVAGVTGTVTGAEIEQHFYNGCADPIEPFNVNADDLPGRR